MATEVVKIVDPDQGAGHDYHSLFDWEAGEQKDLVTADQIAVAKCRCTGGTADNTGVTIDGWTTDSTRYIKIWADPSDTGGDGQYGSYRHLGTTPSGKIYRLTKQLVVKSPNVKIFGLAVVASSSILDGVIYLQVTGNVEIGYVFSRSTGSGAGLILYSGETSLVCYNSIFITAGGYDHPACGAVTKRSVVAATFYNCTAIGVGTVYGAWVSNFYTGDITCYNCIGQTLGGVYSGGGCWATYDSSVSGNYNLSSDSSAPGANSVLNTTVSFVSSANFNFHLTSSIGGASSASVSGLFTDDIDGQTRTTPWDIGADQYVSGYELPVNRQYVRGASETWYEVVDIYVLKDGVWEPDKVIKILDNGGWI